MNSVMSRLKTRKVALIIGASLIALVLRYYWQRKTSREFTRNVKKEKLSALEKQKIPVVVLGPSGVGKGTLLKKVRQKLPGQFAVAVSHTTRKPRKGERDGLDYKFISEDEFQNMIARKDFIEYAKFGENLYGTSFKTVEDVGKKDLICFLEIDLQGARAIKELGIECKFVFIKTSGDTLSKIRQRLDNRSTESSKDIDIRVETAKTELEFLNQNSEFFDLIIENDEVEVAAKLLCENLSSWYQLQSIESDWNVIQHEMG